MAKSRKSQRLYIGTSGWHYVHWLSVFYPKDLPKDKWLQHYSRHFKTVELNNTFYHLPKEKTVENWHKLAPQGFIFSVKVSRYISHVKKLKEVQENINLFFDRMKHLKDNLGPFLTQLPPSFKKEKENIRCLDDYLKALPRNYRQVIEFRHPSWFNDDIYHLLNRYNAALCIVSMPNFPVVLEVTSDFVYIRMHGGSILYGSNYSKKELKECCNWIKRFLDDGLDVYIYFNNDAYGYAVKNALTLKKMFF